MADIFDVAGEEFFRPLTSYYKKIYYRCLGIIYDSYRTELSYGIDRETLVEKLTYYFDELEVSDIKFEDDTEVISDSRNKASTFLRKLKEYGWVEYEIGSDQKTKVTMPGYAVSIFRSLDMTAKGKETEYQSEISAIYSLLTNPDLMTHPYPQVLKPVYDRTVELFTALKQLNTGIKRYIDNLTSDKTAEEIIENYFTYAEEIGSKAYHRLYTSDNVSRFRNMILVKLYDMQNDADTFERLAWGYQQVEDVSDLDDARDKTRKMIGDIVDHFGSYDQIVKEIEKKHAKYLSSTVKRARFLIMNTSNTEGKISTILRYMADMYNKEEIMNLDADASDDICGLFNIFTQGYIGEESLKTVPVSRKITYVEEIFNSSRLNDDELKAIRIAAYEKNKNRFSRKNISAFVSELLKDSDMVYASSIDIVTKRDMIRIIFISLYGQSSNSDFTVTHTENMIEKQGFRYRDFEIRKRRRPHML